MNGKESTKELRSTILVTLLMLVIVVTSMFLTLEDAPQVYKNLHRIVHGTDFEFRYVLIGRTIPYVTVLCCMVEKARRFFLEDEASLWYVLSHFLKLSVAAWMTISTRHLLVKLVLETFPWIAFERTIGGISLCYVLKDVLFFALFFLFVWLYEQTYTSCISLLGHLLRLWRKAAR